MKGAFLGFAFTALLLVASPAYAAPISSVQVVVQGDGGHVLPAPLQKRMEAGIEAANQHILVGKDAEELAAQLLPYEQVEREIISRLLYGYNVASLAIQPGETTQIAIQVAPYGDVVQSLDVELDYGNLSPLAISLLQEDMKTATERAEEMLLGAPLDGMDWLEAVVQSSMRESLQDRVPEFAMKVEVISGVHSTLKIYMIPQGETVRHTEVDVVSETLPNTIFWNTKTYFEKQLTELEGLPVTFVARHVPTLQERIQEALNHSSAVERFHVQMSPEIYAGSTTRLIVHANSDKYVVKAEGRLDMGKKDRNVSLLLHTGVKVTPKHELYLQTEFYPEDYTWKFLPSYQYHVTNFTDIAYQFDAKESDHLIWVQQNLSDAWYLKAQRTWRAKENEFTLGYRIHPYLTAEYILNSDDHWLRLIGHI